MGELFDYAQAMRKINEDQAKRAQTALALLRTAGLPKTLEEAAILCGAMTREQHDALAREVEASWKVKPSVPRISAPNSEKDEPLAAALRRQGRRREVETAQMRQQMLRASGMEIPLWEILEAPSPDEAGRALPQGELVDAIDLTTPTPSPHRKPIATPEWLKVEAAPPPKPPPAAPPPRAAAPIPLELAPTKTPLTPKGKPPAIAPAHAAAGPPRQFAPPQPPAPSIAPPPPQAVAPAPPPKPPTVRAAVPGAGEIERLKQLARKLDLMIKVAAGALALLIILILIVLLSG